MKDFLINHPILSVVIAGIICATVMYVADACVDAVYIVNAAAKITESTNKD